MITIFGWVAAICLAIFAVVFACSAAIFAATAAIAYSPLGKVLRPWLSRWTTFCPPKRAREATLSTGITDFDRAWRNERFNRVAGKIAAGVVVFGGSLCGLAWLTGWSVFGYLWLVTMCWLVVQPRFWL
jgi:hypothetical protein